MPVLTKAWACSVCNDIYESEEQALTCEEECTIKVLSARLKEKKGAKLRRATKCLSRVSGIPNFIERLPIVLRRLYSIEMVITGYTYCAPTSRSAHSANRYQFEFDYLLTIPDKELTLLKLSRLISYSDKLEGISLIQSITANNFVPIAITGMIGNRLVIGTRAKWKGYLIIDSFPKINKAFSRFRELTPLLIDYERELANKVVAHQLAAGNSVTKYNSYVLAYTRVSEAEDTLRKAKAELEGIRSSLLLGVPKLHLGSITEELVECIRIASTYSIALPDSKH